MAVPIIAHERAGPRVEAAILLGAIGVPFRRPRNGLVSHWSDVDRPRCVTRCVMGARCVIGPRRYVVRARNGIAEQRANSEAGGPGDDGVVVVGLRRRSEGERSNGDGGGRGNGLDKGHVISPMRSAPLWRDRACLQDDFLPSKRTCRSAVPTTFARIYKG